MNDSQRGCAHERWHENSRQVTVCLDCGLPIDEYRKLPLRNGLENLAFQILWSSTFQMTPGQRHLMAREAAHFEECSVSYDELMKYTDKELANCYLQAMWDYVRDQI